MNRKWDKAIEYFQKSIELREEMNIPYRLADGYYEFGLMYKEKGDKRNARKYLNRSHKIFEKLGNQRLIETINHELKRL
jgi:tetratricopeptide (TPR) repeat protein